MIKAMFPGSFNPIHNGHIEIIKRASKEVDELIIYVANNPQKDYHLTPSERSKIIEEVIKEEKLANVTVLYQRTSELTPLIAKRENINLIVRGQKTDHLSEHEKWFEDTFKKYFNIEFKRYIAPHYENISSTLVRNNIKNDEFMNLNFDKYLKKIIQEKY